jgi:hypothetical protein
MHRETWNHYCQQLIETGGTKAGLSWMNFGPAADENNEYKLDKHELKIMKGAIVDVKHIRTSQTSKPA